MNGSEEEHAGNGYHVNDQSDLLLDMQTKLNSEEFLRNFELDLPAVDHETIKAATASILEAVGEDPDRDGLKRTPERVARAYEELLSGYRTDPAKLINDAIFDVEYDDMVIVRDIEYYSLCEHHMLPFIGKAHVAYIPQGRVIGLSKIARIVDMFARRLQIQENMTKQIAEAVMQVTQAAGVGVVIEAQHMCMMMRGIEKQNASMKTSMMLGSFRDNLATRNEFMALIR